MCTPPWLRDENDNKICPDVSQNQRQKKKKERKKEIKKMVPCHTGDMGTRGIEGREVFILSG
jgi:hypothetical protein